VIKNFACVTVVVVFGLSLFALAQTETASATGTKIGTINIEQAVYASNGASIFSNGKSARTK
jgi:hypothetical protein